MKAKEYANMYMNALKEGIDKKIDWKQNLGNALRLILQGDKKTYGFILDYLELLKCRPNNLESVLKEITDKYRAFCDRVNKMHKLPHLDENGFIKLLIADLGDEPINEFGTTFKEYCEKKNLIKECYNEPNYY